MIEFKKETTPEGENRIIDFSMQGETGCGKIVLTVLILLLIIFIIKYFGCH